MQPQNMNRKLFLKLTLTSVAATTLASCSSDDGGSENIGDGTTGNTPTGTTSSTTGATGGTTTGSVNSVNSVTSTTGATGTVGTTGATATTGTTTGATGTTTGATGTTTGATGTTTGATGTTTTGTTGSTTGTSTGTDTSTTTGTTTGSTTGAGGTGNVMSCSALTLTHLSTDSQFPHDHLAMTMEEDDAFLMVINGTPGPVEWAGGSPHTHTLTFTAEEITTLLNGGMVMNKVTDEPNGDHTHTYTISCA